MFELRLIDPYGATVPGTQHRYVPEANVAELEDRLRHEVAPAHAADYHVQRSPEPTTAGSGTFLDLLATPIAA